MCYYMLMRLDGNSRRGFSLIEMSVVLMMLVIASALGFQALKPASSKQEAKALALALADELGGAKELAIRSGQPVGIGLSKDGSQVSGSLYRLQGWNNPLVTWSKSFNGDYPSLGFACASWPGSAATASVATTPPGAKFANFEPTDWIPTAKQSDTVFCFTPDGTVRTAAGLPLIDGSYPIVVSKSLSVGGTVVSGAEDPFVVFLGQNGVVRTQKISGSFAGGGAVAHSNPRPREKTNHDTAQVIISELRTIPRSYAAGADGHCVPGQQINFEFYAYDTDGGRDLFAVWNQTAPSGSDRGKFSFPGQGGGDERERMEYVEKAPSDVSWTGTPPPGGCFRGRWTWTVPIDSQPGDTYDVTVNVRDAEGDATILNGPLPQVTAQVAPEGRLIVERQNPVTGLWELVQMNPDGSGEKVLTTPGLEEVMPSINQAGNKIAFIQRTPGGKGVVKVRALNSHDGGFLDQIIAPPRAPGDGDYTSVSISPNGEWVSYRHNFEHSGTAPVVGELITTRVDGTAEVRHPQAWTFGSGSEAKALKKSRTGWTPDSRYMVWGNGHDIMITDLDDPLAPVDSVAVDGPIVSGGGFQEQLFAPTVFQPAGSPGLRLLFTIGNVNPVLAHVPFDPVSTFNVGATSDTTLLELGGAGVTGSGNHNDDLASISASGAELVLPRQRRADNGYEALVVPWTGANFVGPGRVIQGEIRSAVWVPSDN